MTVSRTRTLVQTAALVALCSLPLAAHTRVAENSRLGLKTFSSPSHQGFAEANPLIAPGLAESLCHQGVRSRCSAKERDDESGLDYFLARYYSARLGRFTTVDPGNAGSLLDDPQTWNGYVYVNNNPLGRIDPDGRQALPVSPLPATPPPSVGPQLVVKELAPRVLITAGAFTVNPVVGAVVGIFLFAQPTSTASDRPEFVGPPAPPKENASNGKDSKKKKKNDIRPKSREQRDSLDLSEDRFVNVRDAEGQSARADRTSNQTQEDGLGNDPIADPGQKKGEQLSNRPLQDAAGRSAKEVAEEFEQQLLDGDPTP